MVVEATKTILLALRGPITAADVPQLCDQLAARLRDSDATDAVCDVGALGRPTVATVNALARLQLVARRHGCRIRLRGAGPELLLLLDLVGLRDVVRTDEADGGSVETDPDPPTARVRGCPSPAAPEGRTAGTTVPCPGTS